MASTETNDPEAPAAPVEALAKAEPYRVQESHWFRIFDGEGESIAQCRVYPSHGQWWITDVWVNHKHRRRGLATKVIAAALMRYGGRADLYLQITPYSNQPMEGEQLAAFYASFGFCPMAWPGGMMRPKRKYTPEEE